MKVNWTNYLYIFTIMFFAIGFFNIIFAWLGFACLITPFILLVRDKKKTWCQKYCPRASLFTALFKKNSGAGRQAPIWLTKGNFKYAVSVYFVFNLFILTMSTIMVLKGRIDAVERVRFLIAFQLPWNIPQLLNIEGLSNWVVHLSFRLYSMMFTTTVIGLILGWLYTPRTWCTVCPINTISDISLKR